MNFQHSGLLLLAVDSRNVFSLNMDQVILLLKGQPGTGVVLWVSLFSAELEACTSIAQPVQTVTRDQEEKIVAKFEHFCLEKDHVGLIGMQAEVMNVALERAEVSPDEALSMLSKLAAALHACEKFETEVQVREMLAHSFWDAGDEAAAGKAWLDVGVAEMKIGRPQDALAALKLAQHAHSSSRQLQHTAARTQHPALAKNHQSFLAAVLCNQGVAYARLNQNQLPTALGLLMQSLALTQQLPQNRSQEDSVLGEIAGVCFFFPE